jgi:formylglycine-generating enzyme required for sulfatase activity
MKTTPPISLFNYPQLTKYLRSFCPVIGGPFRIGSNKTPFSDSFPATTVTVRDFYIAKYPVTNALWNEYLIDAGLKHKLKSRRIDAPDLPITMVSWIDIMGSGEGDGFCAWVQRITGQQFTLPKEAEFEYVASNFGKNTRFPWGNTWDPTKLWASDQTVRRSGPAAVYRRRNLYTTKSGAVDMSGNVWQWCLDWYRPYGRPAVLGHSTDEYKMKAVRGGPWNYNNESLFETSTRYSERADISSEFIGFRLAVSASILAQRAGDVRNNPDRPRIWPSVLSKSTGTSIIRIAPQSPDATFSVMQAVGKSKPFDSNNQISCKATGENNIVELVATSVSGRRSSRVYFLPANETVTVTPRNWNPKPVVTDLAQLPYLRRYIDELRLIPGGDRPNGQAAQPFRIGATPVTEGLWYEYLFAINPSGPRPTSTTPDLPISGISWLDVMGTKFRSGFAQWVSLVTGLDLTLPSITEVELALLGESSADLPWTDKYDPLLDEQYTWISTRTKRDAPASVYRSDHVYKSQFGVTDILGNVPQWLRTTIVDTYDGELRGQYFGFGSDFDHRVGKEDQQWMKLDVASWPVGTHFDVGFRLVQHLSDPEQAPQKTGIVLDCIPKSDSATRKIDGIKRDDRTVLTVKKTRSFDVSVTLKGFEAYRAVIQVPKGQTIRHSINLNPTRKRPLSNYPQLQKYLQSLCLVPAATFRMGSLSEQKDERPVHIVNLSAFRIGATPVTFGVWKEYCDATGTALPAELEWDILDDHPAVTVSWNDIFGKGEFCAWASDIAGYQLTLPTEAQFEYAACGGQSGLEYPWGSKFDRNKLWCSGVTYGDAKRTAPVVRTSNIYVNAFGLTDMVGNVRHWCLDWYGPYSGAVQTDPRSDTVSTERGRCVRGSSWADYTPGKSRCARRDWLAPEYRLNDMGFRLIAGPD